MLDCVQLRDAESRLEKTVCMEVAPEAERCTEVVWDARCDVRLNVLPSVRTSGAGEPVSYGARSTLFNRNAEYGNTGGITTRRNRNIARASVPASGANPSGAVFS